MDTVYFAIKSLHIIFVTGWFVGLFYLPRLLGHLSTVPADSHAERERLLVMGRKLYTWTMAMMIPALLFGLALWLGFGIGKGQGWIHVKMVLVVVAIGVHHMCRAKLRKFEHPGPQRAQRSYDVYFVLSIVLFVASTLLVVHKPF